MNHALSTEKEEIMGLLLGHVAEEVSDGRNGRPNFFVAIYLRYQYLSEVGGSYCNVEPWFYLDDGFLHTSVNKFQVIIYL